MSNGIQVLSEFFWRTKFFRTSWSAVFSQVWRRSIFKFCVYKLAEAVRYLKVKWEFVIIGRGCLVLLKLKSSLCRRMLCFKALLRLCSFGIKIPFVNPTSLRAADSQWIIILKTLELVTLSFNQFHAHALHIFNQYLRQLKTSQVDTKICQLQLSKKTSFKMLYKFSAWTHLDLLQVDLLASGASLFGRKKNRSGPPRATKSREVDLSRLMGFPFSFRAKKGDWRDSHLGF